jgi:hypothetical protein
MRKTRLILTAFLLLALLVGGSGCFIKEKVMEVVFGDSTCVPFKVRDDNENFTTPYELDYWEDLDEILADNDLTRDDIVHAHLVSATYQVTDFAGRHDWIISGEITVTRNDIPSSVETIVEYTSQSVAGAMPAPVQAVLVQDGVDLFNQSLEDYLDGFNPVLTFEVVSGDVDPTPSPADSIIFDWEGCLKIQVIDVLEFDMWDPLGGD